MAVGGTETTQQPVMFTFRLDTANGPDAEPND
jgi:hypothetical protein